MVEEVSNDPRFKQAIIPAGNMMGTAEEMGRFNMGSTIVMLMESKTPVLSEALVEGLPVKMGQAISE